MPNKKGVPVLLLAVLVGAMTLQRTLSQPGMERVRNVDIVSLTGAGFCFGIVFAFLIMMLRRK